MNDETSFGNNFSGAFVCPGTCFAVMVVLIWEFSIGSVEMFSCFSLKRMDVLSTGDLGVQ